MAVTTSLNFKTTVAPIYAEAFDGIYNIREDQWKFFCKEIDGGNSDQLVQDVIYGFGSAPLIPDGNPITYDTAGETYVQTYKFDVFGLAFAITEVLMEDGKHLSVGKTLSEHLARSCVETRELNAANILNRGFSGSYTGPDGVALFSASHNGAFGTTYSNLGTAAALSQTSLEAILQQIMQAVNDRGLKINLKPKNLVVPPQLYMQAITLLKSIGRTGTNNNDINPITSKAMLDSEPGMVQRLTSSTAWFVNTDAPQGIQIPVRRKLKKSMEGDFETGSMRYKATFREDTGWTNARGAYGNAGA